MSAPLPRVDNMEGLHSAQPVPGPAGASGSRRTWLLAGAGAAAAAAGLGWQLLRPSDSSSSGTSGDEAAEALWQSRFERPDGSPLLLSTLRGSPLVLNFWATWCPPCLKEMPALDRFAGEFAARGGHVVGLAIDNAAAVRKYLASTPVSYAIGLAGFEGTELSRRLGNVGGALPYTAAFGRDGAMKHRRLGETSDDELRRWAATL